MSGATMPGGLLVLALLLQVAPPIPVLARENEGGRLAVLVTGSAGVQLLGSVLTAGAGAGWSWSATTAAFVVRYSRLHTDYIVFGDGERWEEVRMLEGAAWVTSRPAGGLFQLAFTVGAGPGHFIFNDFGRRSGQRKLAWSVAGGIGLGPLFLLLGHTEPEVAVPDSPGFEIGGATHVSLNLTLDVLGHIRSRRR
jgi:hypothetical protein